MVAYDITIVGPMVTLVCLGELNDSNINCTFQMLLACSKFFFSGWHLSFSK